MVQINDNFSGFNDSFQNYEKNKKKEEVTTIIEELSEEDLSYLLEILQLTMRT